MRNFILSILIILFVIGCNKKQPAAKPKVPALSEAKLISKQIIMDYYQQNNAWPDSTDKLILFYEDNQASYPDNADKICQSLKLRPLQNGCLAVVSHMDVNDSNPTIKVLAKRIDPADIQSLTWQTSMILSPSGQVVNESELDEKTLKVIKDVNSSIMEPISVTIINN